MELLNQYLDDCKLRGLESRTCQTYKSSVKEFLSHYPNPVECTKEDLLQYLQHLQTKDITTGTIRRDFSAISGLYDWLLFMEEVNINPVLQIRTRYLQTPYRQERRQIPTLNEVRELIRSIDVADIRELTLIVFFAKTAGRRGEILDLKVEDIDLNRDLIYWPDKKKRKEKIGFIDSELHILLEEYLRWREWIGPRTSYLWITDNGNHMHKDYPNEIMQHYGQLLGLHDPSGPLYKKLTCHCLRGFLTTQLQRAGMDEIYIMWLRGDSIKKKTWASHYLDIDQELVREQYLRCIPDLLLFE
ncbi:site-specific recombinase XerD [Methanolobus tindarius DSM 2278]|uniref:Site-specific recombinase XerD n=1 Tax=Methanolobus tindarius DSM 2278 TaxID=1090322 RepID=W9DMB5_METTI|nr:phage integrase N-terminal SAM-like domain-containing protein [Methanolobus tindarius]ETA66614.1 site-specific recombinase XerD [Methanolobus tindarius DSM 2278]